MRASSLEALLIQRQSGKLLTKDVLLFYGSLLLVGLYLVWELLRLALIFNKPQKSLVKMTTVVSNRLWIEFEDN